MTQKDNMTRLMVEPGQAQRVIGSKVHQSEAWCVTRSEELVAKHVISRWREKLLMSKWVPVPQTDTGR